MQQVTCRWDFQATKSTTDGEPRNLALTCVFTIAYTESIEVRVALQYQSSLMFPRDALAGVGQDSLSVSPAIRPAGSGR